MATCGVWLLRNRQMGGEGQTAILMALSACGGQELLFVFLCFVRIVY